MNLLSIDLNTTRFNAQSYQNLVESTKCNQLEIHIYNYIEQKHCKLPFCHGEILHKYSGSRKKVALDIKQAVDIVELCTKNFYHNVFILCGEYESEFLFGKLTEMGVPHQKISLANYRQTDMPNVEISQNDIPCFERIHSQSTCKKIDKIAVAQSNDLIEEYQNSKSNDFKQENEAEILQTESQIIPFEKNATVLHNENNFNDEKTKLTIDQIKKIYNYIKFKQMESKLKASN